jgi:hypothetical protein
VERRFIEGQISIASDPRFGSPFVQRRYGDCHVGIAGTSVFSGEQALDNPWSVYGLFLVDHRDTEIGDGNDNPTIHLHRPFNFPKVIL